MSTSQGASGEILKGKETMREEVSSNYPIDIENNEEVEFDIEGNKEDEIIRKGKKRIKTEMEPKKGMRTQPTWWDHFEKYKDVDDVMKARCMYCGIIIIADSKQHSVSLLKKHIMSCKKAPHEVQTNKTQLAFQPSSPGDECSSTHGTWTFDQDKISEALQHMSTVDKLPYETVEKLGYKHFMSVACPDYKIPTRDDLMRQEQSISTALEKQSDIQKKENHIRLSASVDVARLLLHQRLAFRGHDESDESSNKGNFKVLLDYTADQSDIARKIVLKNAPKNNKLNSPSIQKNIVHCFAQEVVKSILDEIGGDVFALLVDESSDISNKEQMTVVLRYVDKYGEVKERTVGLVHVAETSSSYLKSAIDSLFAELGLSLKKVRGQGYDGANNMRGEFNGLRVLITRENNSAYYVHCFAHQLQLVVVAVARKHVGVGNFFDMIGGLLNVVDSSCKKKDMIRESHLEKVQKAIGSGMIETGTGLN